MVDDVHSHSLLRHAQLHPMACSCWSLHPVLHNLNQDRSSTRSWAVVLASVLGTLASKLRVV